MVYPEFETGKNPKITKIQTEKMSFGFADHIAGVADIELLILNDANYHHFKSKSVASLNQNGFTFLIPAFFNKENYNLAFVRSN